MIRSTPSAPSGATSSRKSRGFGESFGVRVVGAEQDVLVADQLGERHDVLLVIRRHEHVAPEDVARVAR